MTVFQLTLILLCAISLILPFISYRYFVNLMRLVRISIGPFLVAGSSIILIGYLFFISPWIIVGKDIDEIRLISYIVIMAGLSIILYATIKIYLDWRDVTQ